MHAQRPPAPRKTTNKTTSVVCGTCMHTHMHAHTDIHGRTRTHTDTPRMMDWKDGFSVAVPVLGLGVPAVGTAMAVASVGGRGNGSDSADGDASTTTTAVMASPLAWFLLLVAAVVCELGSKVLKRVVYAASSGAAFSRRPQEAFACNGFARERGAGGRPGFPSGHASLVGLYATVLMALALCVRQRGRGPTQGPTQGRWRTHTNTHSSATRVASVAFAAVAALVLVGVNAYVRTAKGCHTPLKVAAGTAWGTLVGAVLVVSVWRAMYSGSRDDDDASNGDDRSVDRW